MNSLSTSTATFFPSSVFAAIVSPPRKSLAAMSFAYPGTKRHRHFTAQVGLAQRDLKVVPVHAGSPHTVDGNSDDFKVSRFEEVGQHVDGALPALPVRFEIEAEIVVALFLYVGADVDVGEVIQLEGVVTSRMTLLIAVIALYVGQPVIGDPEEKALVVVVEEKEVPERRRLSCELQILLVARIAVEDQVSKNGLLLLPEVFGVAPGELIRHPVLGLALHGIEAPATELV